MDRRHRDDGLDSGSGSLAEMLSTNGAVVDFPAALVALLSGRGGVRAIERRTGVSKSTVAQILARQRVPHRATVELLVRAYDPAREQQWLAAWNRARSSGPVKATASRIGRLLPGAAHHYRGRDDSISRLRQFLESSSGNSCLVYGMAGVGKSALVLHVAHQTAAFFDDGCHFIKLDGYTRASSPRAAYETAGVLLHRMGLSDGEIAADEDLRLAQWHGELEHRHTMVILDDAMSAAQVAPLLFGAGASKLVITSRQQLPSLDVMSAIGLDCLGDDDGAELLLAGIADRSEPPDREALRRISALCGGLPLALRIASSKLSRRPTWTATDLEQRLARERSRLHELEDDERSLSAAFEVSYRDLSWAQQRLFRILGRAPATDITGTLAAVLLGTDPRSAERLLEDLAAGSLLIEVAPGRFRFHDLLSEYSFGLPPGADTGEQGAPDRLLDWYAEEARQQISLLLDGSLDDDARLTVATARVWFEANQENLTSALRYAVERGSLPHASRLWEPLERYLHSSGQYANAFAASGLVVRVATRHGEELTAVRATLSQARASTKMGHRDDGLRLCQDALRSCESVDDVPGQAMALRELGNLEFYRGEFASALAHYDAALPLDSASGNRDGEGTNLNNIGAAHWQLGNHQLSIDAYERALAVRRMFPNIVGVAQTLNNLGLAYERLGWFERSQDALEEALELGLTVNDPAQVSSTHVNLANILRQRQEFTAAAEHLDQALDIARRLSSPRLEAETLNALGELRLAEKRPDDAGDSFGQALSLTTGGADRYEEAHALEGLAAVAAARGDTADARRHLARAVQIYGEVGARSDVERLTEHVVIA